MSSFSFRALYLALFLLCVCFAGSGMGQATRFTGGVNEAALQRFQVSTTPLLSADGMISVRSLVPERSGYRYPVLRFADAVRRNFSERVFPIGSRDFPLAIELGAETNVVAKIERRHLRTEDGFSQLIIRVPNPDTVDLDLLRVAVAEAQLRESARAQGGSYTSLTWPKWLIAAMVDASRNNTWRAEAYETARELYDAGSFPTVDECFKASEAPVSKEFAAFFAMWLLELHRKDPVALLTMPWNRFSVVGLETDRAWEEWFVSRDATVFVPGLLTRSQYARWKKGLVEPEDVGEAMQLSSDLTREAMGKPPAFRDLTYLYLKAYGAFATGHADEYQRLRAEADEAAATLDVYFRNEPLLFAPSTTPYEADEPSSSQPIGDHS